MIEKEDYYYLCTFKEEFDVVKQLESLGFDIRAKHSFGCCEEQTIVIFNGECLIPKNLTAKESIYISDYIANTVGITGIHPYITTDGEIMIRFFFATLVEEEYVTDDKFELFKQYKWR